MKSVTGSVLSGMGCQSLLTNGLLSSLRLEKNSFSDAAASSSKYVQSFSTLARLNQETQVECGLMARMFFKGPDFVWLLSTLCLCLHLICQFAAVEHLHLPASAFISIFKHLPAYP